MHRETYAHPDGIEVDLICTSSDTLDWEIRYRGRELAEGDGFRPSPLIDPTGKLAAADLVALALHGLQREGKISEGDPAHDAATLLILDFEEEGGRS